MTQEEHDRLNEILTEFKAEHREGGTTGEHIERIFGSNRDLQLLIQNAVTSYLLGDYYNGHLVILMIATLAYEKGRKDMMQ